MCASREYPSLGWKWDPSWPSIYVYCMILWEDKYKEDHEKICNGLFAPIYHILFGEKAPCMSPEGQALVQKYGNWYMTLDGVYLRMIGRTKAPQLLPHFILDKFLLQEITYQTFINGVSSSLLKAKRGDWPCFPLSTKMCMIETIKQAKDEVNMLSSFRFIEMSF